CFQTLEFPWTF
nr:immunoglobulin light chain junction region [Macaca mulatta]MOX23605.1 immunoglobulin light chain junction region [Macaca mulatta]MOX23622.1 immunoglobulin light chain junction region [Macaca mulatta]MOX23631.1 immunoglobulin light chain junction region [Macaca mulatta]MOX23915.1 immunoglobulin light chain junction region [Macaca mulatta]